MKDFAIETFGEDDKVALVIGILAFSVVFAAVLGIVARHRLRLAQAGFAAFAAVGMWASQQAVGAPLDAIVPSLAAGLTGIGGLWFFHGRTLPATDTHMDTDADMDVAATVAPAAAGASDAAPVPEAQPTMAGLAGTGSRRTFLFASAGFAVAAAALAGGGRALRSRFNATRLPGGGDAAGRPYAACRQRRPA